MVCCLARLPLPAFSQHHVEVGLEEIPAIVAVVPGAATDETVALAVVHLAGKAVSIRSVVAVVVAVVVRVAVYDIVVGTVAAVVLRNAREGVAELMSEAELQAGVEVIRELAALYAVVRPLQFDAVVSGMGDVQAKEPPVVAGDEQAAVAHHLVVQLVHEVKDGLLAFVGAYDDRSLLRTAVLDAYGIFAVALFLRIVRAATADDVRAGSGSIDGLLQVVPWTLNGAVAVGVAVGGKVYLLYGCWKRLRRHPRAFGDVRRVVNLRLLLADAVQRNGDVVQIDSSALTGETYDDLCIFLL